MSTLVKHTPNEYLPNNELQKYNLFEELQNNAVVQSVVLMSDWSQVMSRSAGLTACNTDTPDPSFEARQTNARLRG